MIFIILFQFFNRSEQERDFNNEQKMQFDNSRTSFSLHKYARDLQKNAGLVLVFRGFVKDFSDCFRNFVFISRI